MLSKVCIVLISFVWLGSSDVDVAFSKEGASHLTQHSGFSLQISGPYASDLESVIVAALHREGLLRNEAGNILVKGEIIFERSGPKSRTVHFMRWRTRITLEDRQTGAVFATIRRTGRSGQPSKEKAIESALGQMKAELTEAVVKRMVQFIFSKD